MPSVAQVPIPGGHSTADGQPETRVVTNTRDPPGVERSRLAGPLPISSAEDEIFRGLTDVFPSAPV